MAEFLIWWINQADCERIVPVESWPVYLYDEYQNCQGRAGNGRLWVSSQLKGAPRGVPVMWDTANNWLCAAASDAAGIVIKSEHACEVQFMPGFLTTFEMAYPGVEDTRRLCAERDLAVTALKPFASIGLDVLKNRPGWANEVFASKWAGVYRITYAQFEMAAAAVIKSAGKDAA